MDAIVFTETISSYSLYWTSVCVAIAAKRIYRPAFDSYRLTIKIPVYGVVVWQSLKYFLSLMMITTTNDDDEQ